MAFPVPDAVAGLLGIEGESWQDRIAEASYTSPESDTTIKFEFENVGRSTPLRNRAFQFPGRDGAYIQENGLGARVYPLRCIFSGPSHDLIATAFESACFERGHGRLVHPFYGEFDVVPMGEIKRRDDLKTAANQSIVEVTFWRPIKSLYPSSEGDAEDEIAAALAGFDVAAAQALDDGVDFGGVANALNAAATVREFLRDISAALTTVSDATTATRRGFADQMSVINYGLDVLVGQPLQLAQQMQNLIAAPAVSLAGIRSRLDSYSALAASIFASDSATPGNAGTSAAIGGTVGSRLATLRTRAANNVQLADLVVTASVAGSIRAAVDHTFATRAEALTAAVELLEQLDTANEWRETQLAAVDAVDTGEAYQALQHAAAIAAGHLIEVSFSLRPERVIVLDRERTIIDLAAELYGEVDARLDFLIESNGLTGSEVLELPRGTAIRYYVD